MSIEITPSNRVHADSDVKLRETSLVQGDRLIVTTDAHMTEIENFLNDVMNSVNEFRTKLENTIDVNQLDRIKGQLGNLSLLSTTETVMTVLDKLNKGLSLKAEALDLANVQRSLLSKADVEELLELKNTIGTEALSQDLTQTVIGSINALLIKLNNLAVSLENYTLKNGDTLTGKLVYEKGVNNFTGRQIPHVTWVNNQLKVKIGNLENTGINNNTSVETCLTELRTEIDLFTRFQNKLELLIGDISTTGIPETDNSTVASSLKYLNTKSDEHTLNIETLSKLIQGLALNKADKDTVQAIEEKIELIKGAHVVVSVLTETKDELSAMDPDALQEFLNNKVAEAGRPSVETGYEIRTSDGYKYYSYNGTWYYVDSIDFAVASNTTLGVVKLSNKEGYITASGDNDGTIKVSGYDDIKSEIEVIKEVVNNKVDGFTYLEKQKDVEMHLGNIDNEITNLETKLNENVVISNQADSLSKQNQEELVTVNETITNIQDNINGIREKVSENESNISIAKQSAVDAANSALASEQKAEEAKLSATSAKDAADNANLVATQVLDKIGDLSSTGLNNKDTVADGLKELNRGLSIFNSISKDVLLNENIRQVFSNGTLLRDSTLSISNSHYSKPTMFIDRRGYLHLFANYREENVENSPSEVVYVMTKDMFKTKEEKIFLQRDQYLASPNSRIESATIVYDRDTDTPYVLLGIWNNEEDWTTTQSWLNAKLAIGTWSNIDNRYNWTFKTIGKSGCEINIRNIPNTLTGFKGGVSNGLKHPETGELILPVQWTEGNGNIRSAIIRTLDGVEWLWKDFGNALENMSEPSIYRCINGSGDHIHLLGKSTVDRNLKVRFSPNRGDNWEIALGLTDKLIGNPKCNQATSVTLNTVSGRSISIVATNNFIDNYPLTRNSKPDRLNLYLASEKSALYIPVETISLTGSGCFYSCLDFAITSAGDKLYVHYETPEGTFVKDLSYLIPRLEMLHDVFDKSNNGLTDKQKEQIEDMIADAGIIGNTGVTSDSISRKIKELQAFDTEITKRVNEIKKMLEGSIKGVRFVGIINKTKREVLDNKQLLTDFVNNRYTDPMEQLRVGDVISTKDKYTFVYLRNDLGTNEWTDYNVGGDLGDILNRIDQLENFKTTTEIEILELLKFKTKQEAFNTEVTNALQEINTVATENSNKLGDLQGTGITDDTSVTTMLKELKDTINSNNLSIQDLDNKIGNLADTGLVNIDSVTSVIKEIIDGGKVKNAAIEQDINNLKLKDAEIEALLEKLDKAIKNSAEGMRFVGIVNATNEQVTADMEILTNFVNGKYLHKNDTLRLGDIVSTKDKYTYVYLRQDDGSEAWELYRPNDLEDKIVSLGLEIEKMKLLIENQNNMIMEQENSLTDLLNPGSDLGRKISGLEAKDKMLADLIGDLNTGYSSTNVTDIIKEIKARLDSNNSLDLIGDLSTTGLVDQSTVSAGLKELNDKIGDINTENININALIKTKADKINLDELAVRLERVEGSHVIVSVITETRDEVEGQFDRDGFLDQKVIDSGRDTIETGYEIRTSDGYGYYNYKGRWYESDIKKIAIATENNPGLIKFKDELGFVKGSGNGDGTAVVTGFTDLNNEVTLVKNSVTNKVDSTKHDADIQDLKDTITAFDNRVTQALDGSMEAIEKSVILQETINNINSELPAIKEQVKKNKDNIGDLRYTGLSHTDNIGNALKEIKDQLDEISLFNENEDYIDFTSFKLPITAGDFGGTNTVRDIFAGRKEVDLGGYSTGTTKIFRSNSNYPQLTIQKQNTNKIDLRNWVNTTGEYVYSGNEPFVDIEKYVDEGGDLQIDFSFNIANVQDYVLNQTPVQPLPTIDILPCFTLLSKDTAKTTIGLSYKGRFNSVNENAFIVYLNRLEIFRLDHTFENIDSYQDYYTVSLFLDSKNNKLKLTCNGKTNEHVIAGVNVLDLVNNLKGLVMFFSDVSETYTTRELFFKRLRISGPKVDYISRLMSKLEDLENLIGDLSITGIPDDENDTVSSSLKHLKNEIEATKNLVAEALEKAMNAENNIDHLEREITELINRAQELTEKTDRLLAIIGTMESKDEEIFKKLDELEANKVNKTDLTDIYSKLDVLDGAHVVAAVLTETKDVIEAMPDKVDFLNQKVLDAGKPSVETGVSLKTSDGFMYYFHEGTWYVLDRNSITVATTTNLGIVKFKDEEGYISTGDGDGTSKVFGYDTLKQQVEDNKQNIETNKQDIADLKQQVSDNKQQIDTNKQAIEDIKNKVDNDLATKQELEQVKNDLTTEVEQLKQNDALQDTKLQQVENKANNNEQEISDIKNALGSTTPGSSLQDQINNLKQETDKIGDLTNTGVTGNTVGDQLQNIKDQLDDQKQDSDKVGNIDSTGLNGGTVGEQLTDAKNQIDSLNQDLNNKANSNDVYDKNTIDTMIGNVSNTFLDGFKVPEVNWNDKANVGDSYPIAETYNKTEIDQMIQNNTGGVFADSYEVSKVRWGDKADVSVVGNMMGLFKNIESITGTDFSISSSYHNFSEIICIVLNYIIGAIQTSTVPGDTIADKFNSLANSSSGSRFLDGVNVPDVNWADKADARLIGEMNMLPTRRHDTLVNSIQDVLYNVALQKAKDDKCTDEALNKDLILEEYLIKQDGVVIETLSPVNRYLGRVSYGIWRDRSNIRLKHIDTGELFSGSIGIDFTDKEYEYYSKNEYFGYSGLTFSFRMMYTDYETNVGKLIDLDTNSTLQNTNRPHMPSSRHCYSINIASKSGGVTASLHHKGYSADTEFQFGNLYLMDVFSKEKINDWVIRIVYTGESTSDIFIYCNNKYIGKYQSTDIGYGDNHRVSHFDCGMFSADSKDIAWGNLVTAVKVYKHGFQEGSVGKNYAVKNIEDKSLEKAWYSGDSVNLDLLYEDFKLDNQMEERYTKGIFKVLDPGYTPLPFNNNTKNTTSFSGRVFKHKTSGEKLSSIGSLIDTSKFTKFGSSDGYANDFKETYTLEFLFRYTENISGEYTFYNSLAPVDNNSSSIYKPTEFIVATINDNKIDILFNTTTSEIILKNTITNNTVKHVINRSALNTLQLVFTCRDERAIITMYLNKTNVGTLTTSHIGYKNHNSFYRLKIYPLEYYYGMLYKNIRIYNGALSSSDITSSKTYKTLEEVYKQLR